MEAPETHRLKLTLHYDGAAFHGWQFQPEFRTVQGEVQEALVRLTGRPRRLVGSGRTDAGVHATGQVAAVDLPVRWSAAELRKALNAVLGRDIWIADIRTAHPLFHPRFDAVARSYEYRVGTEDSSHSPFHRRWCWALGEPLRRDLLDAVARKWQGEHSFRSFAKSGQPKRDYRCRVDAAAWHDWEGGILLRITANRYLHHMVRYLVGTAVDVARGRRDVSDVDGLLEGRPGLVTSSPAPPQGLFLVGVEYPHPDVPAPGPPTLRRSSAPRS